MEGLNAGSEGLLFLFRGKTEAQALAKASEEMTRISKRGGTPERDKARYILRILDALQEHLGEEKFHSCLGSHIADEVSELVRVAKIN